MATDSFFYDVSIVIVASKKKVVEEIFYFLYLNRFV